MANLEHIKGSRTQILNGFPSNSFGSDGDIVTANIKGKGVYLCIKNNSRWFVADKLNDLRQLDRPTMQNLTLNSLSIKSSNLTTSNATGDFTLDVNGDIALIADGGNITMDDGAQTIFDFDVDGVNLKIMDDANTSDYFNIAVGAEGATTISTVDADSAAAHLTLQPDGKLLMEMTAQDAEDDGWAITNNSHNMMTFKTEGGAENTLKIYEAGAPGVDYFQIEVQQDGVTNISTSDAAGTAANLTLDVDGDIELNADGGNIDFKDAAVTLAQIVKGGAGNEFYLQSAVGTANYLKLYTTANGASIISTVDSDGTAGHLKISPNGRLELQADTGGVYLLETADAGADSAGSGQVWVHDTTPNELCFTDDAGTDIIGIGKYHYETKISNFYGNATGNYIPLAGYTIERTSTTGNNEFIAMIAAFDGTLEKLCWRSEVAHDGTAQILVYESSDNTEVPGTLIYRKDVTIDIADDTFQDFDMTSPSLGSFPAPITKGRIYAIKLTTPSIPYDINVTTVWKWDITS